jgi:hypothetical protein
MKQEVSPLFTCGARYPRLLRGDLKKRKFTYAKISSPALRRL